MFKFLDKNIQLEETSHTYNHSKLPDTDFISVTRLLKPYFEPFKSIEIATELCANVPKYMDIKPEELVMQWNAARDHGSLVHHEIDSYIKEEINPTELKSKNGIKWLNKYRDEYDLDLLSEVIVYSADLCIAGTIDLLPYDKYYNSYEIIDWKTNKKINKSSFYGKTGIHPITLDLADCNFNHYALQLSLYRYLLEESYNLKISNQMIVHITDKKCRKIQTPYYKDHIIEIIKERRDGEITNSA